MMLTVCLFSLYSRQDPNLWVQALSYFASVEQCKKFIAEVLQHIEENHLMPPLMVVQTLADSQYATLSDIKVHTMYTYYHQNYMYMLLSVHVHVHALKGTCISVRSM